MVICKRCSEPILSINHSQSGMHRKCWRIAKGHLQKQLKRHYPKAKTLPNGSIKGAFSIKFNITMHETIFDQLAAQYLASPFEGSFSRYLVHLIVIGAARDNL